MHDPTIYLILPDYVDQRTVYQLILHANRGRLLLQTPGPVLFGTCMCSTCWDQRRTISMRHYTSLWQYYRTFHFTESEISPDIGFHRAYVTGVACRQGTLTPPDTWSCPTFGLASVLMLRPISPELVLFLDFWVSNIPRYFCFCFGAMDLWLCLRITKIRQIKKRRLFPMQNAFIWWDIKIPHKLLTSRFIVTPHTERVNIDCKMPFELMKGVGLTLTCNQLYFLNILVPICSDPPPTLEPAPFISRSDLILFGHISTTN